MGWPSIQKALVADIRATLRVHCATKVASDIEIREKFIRISRGPGIDDGITDSPLIDVECFSTDYGTAEALAEDVRTYFHDLVGRSIGAVLVDRVRTELAPSYVDYQNPMTNRFVSAFRLEYRQ